MSLLSCQIRSLLHQVLPLIDCGEVLPISEFESVYNDGNIVTYIEEYYNLPTPMLPYEDLRMLFSSGDRPYVSETDAKDNGLGNNGLVYLVDILINMLVKELLIEEVIEEEVIEEEVIEDVK